MVPFAPFITGVVIDGTHLFVDASLISAGAASGVVIVHMLVARRRIEEPKADDSDLGL